MQDKVELLKELMQKAEEFIKTNVELYRLKLIDKVTDVFSSIASAVIIGLVFLFFITMISLGIALWIGESMGHAYYGFMIVAGFYFVVGLFLVITKKSLLESSLNNYMVGLIFKEKNHEGNKK